MHVREILVLSMSDQAVPKTASCQPVSKINVLHSMMYIPMISIGPSLKADLLTAAFGVGATGRSCGAEKCSTRK